MKNTFLLLLIVIISTINLQGCVEQNNNENKLVTASLNTLGFTSNQLPDDVIKQNEFFDDETAILEFPTNITISLLELYMIEYTNNESQPFLTLEIQKLNSSEVGKELFDIKKDDFSGPDHTVLSINEQGDESIIYQYGKTYIILFRKYNVVSTLSIISVDIDLEKSIEYAEIILGNIESKV